MRRLVPLSLIALLLLSGCTGGFGPGASPTTHEPTSGATTQQLDPAEADLPPGVNGSGVTNASALAAAHNETLRQKGFVLNGTFVRDGPNAGTNVRRYRTEMSPGGERYHSLVLNDYYEGNETDGEPSRRFVRDLWGGPSGTYDRVTTPRGSTAVGTKLGIPPWLSLTRAPQYEAYLEIGDFRVEQVVARDGHTYTTLVANRTSEGIDENVTFGGRLVVDERGVIHRGVIDITSGPDQKTDHAEYRVVKLGGSPERPDWVANVTETEQSTTATE